MQKGKAAADRIKAATGNDNVVAMELDLSLMKSVRKFAECFLQQETRLDILINNAGVAGQYINCLLLRY
jgi:NAD(P)-dependent dehydrogenase (short-subunit alcohol dehydrogenase family)